MLVMEHQRGASLIELAIVVVIVGILLALGVPSFATWIQSSQVRTAAESMSAGLQLARGESVKRNTPVRFQLVDSLTSSCALAATGSVSTATNWVISLNSAAGKCDKVATATAATADPFIVSAKSRGEGTTNVRINPDQASIVFNGLGQVTPLPAGTITIALTSAVGTCVVDSGNIRCLDVQVTPTGQVRMCDTAVTTTGDPRKCL